MNERGTGSAQYHPRMMLALLVYCYANGIFGSRRIEWATYRDLGVRYVAANSHPDHDTICTFRRSNFEAVAEAFLQVLLLAKEQRLLRVGTVSVDGTKVDANANKRNSIRYDRAGALREQLRGEIAGCWIRRNTPTRTTRRTRRGCRRSCRGARRCGRSWTVRARSWNVRRRVRTRSRRSTSARWRRGSGGRNRARVGTSSRQRRRGMRSLGDRGVLIRSFGANRAEVIIIERVTGLEGVSVVATLEASPPRARSSVAASAWAVSAA